MYYYLSDWVSCLIFLIVSLFIDEIKGIIVFVLYSGCELYGIIWKNIRYLIYDIVFKGKSYFLFFILGLMV